MCLNTPNQVKHAVIHKMGLHADDEGAVTLNVWQKKQNKKGCPRIIFIKWHEMNYVPQVFSYGLCLTRSYWTVKDAEYHRILREKSKCWEKEREKPSVACSGACRKCNQSLFFIVVKKIFEKCLLWLYFASKQCTRTTWLCQLPKNNRLNITVPSLKEKGLRVLGKINFSNIFRLCLARGGKKEKKPHPWKELWSLLRSRSCIVTYLMPEVKMSQDDYQNHRQDMICRSLGKLSETASCFLNAK